MSDKPSKPPTFLQDLYIDEWEDNCCYHHSIPGPNLVSQLGLDQELLFECGDRDGLVHVQLDEIPALCAYLMRRYVAQKAGPEAEQ